MRQIKDMVLWGVLAIINHVNALDKHFETFNMAMGCACLAIFIYSALFREYPVESSPENKNAADR